mmetsp:Transcript_88486/g.250819  ORF Transcript_88486/g.250819 Transcript_88486/m.250819 type:complete len:226 (-) Transcript_88486:828-1505(-)
MARLPGPDPRRGPRWPGRGRRVQLLDRGARALPALRVVRAGRDPAGLRVAAGHAVLAGSPQGAAGQPAGRAEEGQGAFERQGRLLAGLGAAHGHPHLRAHDARRQGERRRGPHVAGPDLRHGRRRRQRLGGPALGARRPGSEQRDLRHRGGPLHHEQGLRGPDRGSAKGGPRGAGHVLRGLQVLRALRAAELVLQIPDLLVRDRPVHVRALLAGHGRLPELLLGH